MITKVTAIPIPNDESTFLGAVREILGNGSVFGVSLVPANFTPALIFILAPGGFITIGIIMACINIKKERDAKKKKVTKKWV